MSLTPEQARRIGAELLGNAGLGEIADEPPPPVAIAGCSIVSTIGSGGMGTVYEARQEHPARAVAIKVIRRAALTPKARRRFHFEVETLGALVHPGVARLYDAGMHDDGGGGIPYFVMEYVPDAKPITSFGRAHDLSLDERLSLFARVCDAVHYGHRKGVIHRDLKPANILVAGEGSETPADAQPKIIDFGVALATDFDVTVTTMHTDATALVGTLQYMSPEQADGRTGDVDIRSDVYSLGLILHELVHNRPPYEVSGASLTGAARIIRETEPAPADRRLPRGLRRIQTICLKALAKDPDQRYQSAAELADDVHRFLRGEPLEAQPPSTWVRSMRWLQRHPVAATAALCSLLLVGTLAGLAFEIWFLRQRPYEVQVSRDGSTARLLTIAGRELHAWGGPGESISFAQWMPMSDRDDLVLVGYRRREEDLPHLCAYPVTGDRDEPVWSDVIAPNEMAQELIGDHPFHVTSVMVADVFPAEGSEIIAVHQIEAYSLCAVRILGSDGSLLYQIWHVGNLRLGHWMDAERCLVLTGLDARVPANKRGMEIVDLSQPVHPSVVLGLTPTAGHIATRFAIENDTIRDPTVLWSPGILPAEESMRFETGIADLTPTDDGSVEVRILVFMRSQQDVGFTLLLGPDGKEIPGGRNLLSTWEARDPPVDHSSLSLGDLPQITSGE